MSMSATDPSFDLEVFNNAVSSIADAMAHTIMRTAYSGVLKDNMDFAAALADAEGGLVSQSQTQPSQLGSTPTALRAVLERFKDDIAPGDVFVLNDPFAGGMHLPDIFLFKPIYTEGRRLAFAATCCHHTDVGGRVAGSNAADSTETYQEGLRIPPLKLYAGGEPDESLLALIGTNVRAPAKVYGDLRAQLAACHIAEKQLHELVRRYGADKVRSNMQDLIDHAFRVTRVGLAGLPDGVVSFEDWIDDDGIDANQPIRIYVTVTKKGERITVDWTGCAPQVKGAINHTLSCTKAVAYTCVKSILPVSIPNNEGMMRAIDVIAPAGTIANCVLPAACAARGLTSFRMVDCLFGALAMLVPEQVFAASDGGNTGISIGGFDQARRPFIYVDFTCGTWGGRPWSDGLDGNSNLFANMASASVEVTEAEYPIQLLAYEFVTDRAGAGKYRGGTPYRRDYRFLEEAGTLQVRSDRRAHRPYGLYGGQPGKPSMNYLDPDGENRLLTAKLTTDISRGEVFRHEVAGAGGWGDPLDREPTAVLRDVRNELISEGVARTEYGVVLDVKTWTVDEVATASQRELLLAERGWESVPIVSRV